MAAVAAVVTAAAAAAGVDATSRRCLQDNRSPFPETSFWGGRFFLTSPRVVLENAHTRCDDSPGSATGRQQLAVDDSSLQWTAVHVAVDDGGRGRDAG